MQISPGDENRNVVPRWRATSVLPTWEIAPARALVNIPRMLENMFEDDLSLWRREGTLSAAVDIYDVGILTNSKALQLEGIGPILARAKDVPLQLIESVRRTLAGPQDIDSRRSRFSELEQNTKYLIATIKIWKRRVAEFPRDTLAFLEIARLQSVLGQISSAEKYLRRAVYLSPNSRVVLRAAVQFYNIAGDVSQSLPILLKSDAIKHDPLLQSAEIAAADLSNKGSRFARDAVRRLKGVHEVGILESELALATATLEMHSGAQQRRVFQMVRAGIRHGTENAAAQAVWLGEQTDRSLHVRYPEYELADDAFEAKCLSLFDKEEYANSIDQARLWLIDQPFATMPVAIICTGYTVYLDEPRTALPFALRGIDSHPDEWTVLNAALLVFIGVGDYVRADQIIQTMEKISNNPTVRAFSSAGAGMLAFAKGDIHSARLHYDRSINLSKREKRADLVMSAYVFYVLGESQTGGLSTTGYDKAVIAIDNGIRRLPSENRDYAKRLWRVLKPRVAFSVQSTAGIDIDDADVLDFIDTISNNLQLEIPY